jgi:pilus assembly protein Flp/PilA
MFTKFYAKVQALWATREQGATAVEYGLMVALIAAVIVVVVTALGVQLRTIFNTVLVAIGGASAVP